MTVKKNYFQKIDILFLCLYLLMIPLFASAAPPSLDVRSTPPLIIGTLLFNPPFETSDPKRNVYSGFEMDIMAAVCQRIKVQCKYVALPTLKTVFKALNEGQINVAVASLIVLKGDGEHVFSTPYLPSGIQFFVKKESNINSIADIMQSKIGTINDPLIKILVTVNYAKNYPVVIYDTAQAGIDDLAAGKIDVFVTQAASAKYWLSMIAGTFKLVGKPIPIGLGNGIMALTGTEPLINQINQALFSMENDGTYARIYNRYGFFSETILIKE